MDKVNFRKMENGTAEDYAFLDKLEDKFKSDLPNRLIEALKGLQNSISGYQINRLDILFKVLPELSVRAKIRR